MSKLVATGALFFLTVFGFTGWSAEPVTKSYAYVETAITAEDRDHWSFQPVKRVTVPAIESSAIGSAIDAYVAEQLAKVNLTLAPEADRATLLRRLKLNLLGLPPSSDELEEFVNDESNEAYERRVEIWLASPRFGEHAAQAWLDLARFAETDGFEHDKVREDAWRYRDWIIDAFNTDMSYDEFLLRQLAGDLLDASDKIATMFLLAGPDMPDLNQQELRRHDRLNELTATVGSSLLGLQFQCAQCHDHKYDPISQGDFYRLRAVFETAIPNLQRDKPFFFFEGSHSVAPAKIYHRGELNLPGAEVMAAWPRIATADRSLDDQTTTQPRVSFAKWLFHPSNPFTARVIVNRVWQHHFGRGIFENPSDVGVVAGGPTHPEMLDWLATQLREHHWSLKELHRQIVLSRTFRQSSRRAENNPRDTDDWQQRLTLDPENRLLSRFPRRRLSGEVTRDCLLSVSGLINFETTGPSVRPPLAAELTSTLLKGQWEVSSLESDHYRRSIYIFARRNLRYPLFEVFDRPDAGASCPQRLTTTTASQSLQMLNSQLVANCSTKFAMRVVRETFSEELAQFELSQMSRMIEQVFRIAYSRSPTSEELERVQGFIHSQSSDLPASKKITAVCHALLNSSEFIFVD